MSTEGQISGHWTTGDLARIIFAALADAGVVDEITSRAATNDED